MRRVVVPPAALPVTATAYTATPERPRAVPGPAPTRTTEQAACPTSTVHHSHPPSAVPGFYPSTGTVPAPGCRTPAASVAGQRVGSITVRAVQ